MQYKGHQFSPWSGKTPHAVEQLRPCAATTEPASLWAATSEARMPTAHALQQEKSLQWEAWTSQQGIAPTRRN